MVQPTIFQKGQAGRDDERKGLARHSVDRNIVEKNPISQNASLLIAVDPSNAQQLNR